MKTATPLLTFMRAMSAEQKRQFARDASEIRSRLARAAMHPEDGITKITVLYLTQLSCMDRSPNPRLLTAMPIVEASRKWSHLLQLPPLSLEDLLVPTLGVGEPAEAASRRAKKAKDGA